MTAVYSGLTNQLNLQDNFSCKIQYFSIVAGALDTDNTYTFPFAVGRQPAELNAYCSPADGNYVPLYPQVSWNFINNQIVINGIKGLTATKKYNFVVVVK